MTYQIPEKLSKMTARQVMRTTYAANNLALHGVCTVCAHCALTLTDSMSIETGLGPVCRKKARYDDPENADKDETVAMALLAKHTEVFDFLINNCGKNKSLLMKAMVRIASLNRNTELHRDITNAIEALGWVTLANHLRKPFAAISISKNDDWYALKIQKKYFSYEYWSLMREFVEFRFDRLNRQVLFTQPEKAKVWHILKICYPNFVLKTPEGFATIPGPSLINNAVS